MSYIDAETEAFAQKLSPIIYIYIAKLHECVLYLFMSIFPGTCVSDVCPNQDLGHYHYCGTCSMYVVCEQGVAHFFPCLLGDNFKLLEYDTHQQQCVEKSTTCTECRWSRTVYYLTLSYYSHVLLITLQVTLLVVLHIQLHVGDTLLLSNILLINYILLITNIPLRILTFTNYC